MGLLERVRAIIRANISDILNRAEDPEKALDQMIADMNENLVKARQAAALAIAAQSRLQAQYEQRIQAAEEWQRRAAAAVDRGDDDAARDALRRKLQYQQEAKQLHESLQAQSAHLEDLRSNVEQLGVVAQVAQDRQAADEGAKTGRGQERQRPGEVIARPLAANKRQPGLPRPRGRRLPQPPDRRVPPSPHRAAPYHPAADRPAPGGAPAARSPAGTAPPRSGGDPPAHRRGWRLRGRRRPPGRAASRSSGRSRSRADHRAGPPGGRERRADERTPYSPDATAPSGRPARRGSDRSGAPEQSARRLPGTRSG